MTTQRSITKKKPQADEFDKLVGKYIKNLRKLHKITQEQLAEHAGVTFQQIQKYERGLNRISCGRLQKIAKAFDLMAWQIMQNAESLYEMEGSK